MIIINYKSLKDLILVIIIDYNCQKIIIIIRYNRLFTPKLGCGSAQFGLVMMRFESPRNQITED